ncbi:hypothetical protein HDU79_008429, partial [Rhizoclosmatium sp. JEL0117]
SRNKRYIIIGVSIAVLAIGGGLTAYFVTRNNTIASPGSEATATPTGNPTTPSPSQRKKLFGYWGQAAVSNGVGPLGMGTRPAPPTSQEQKMLRVYCDTGLYDSINLAFLYSFGGGDGSWGIDFGYVGPGNPQGNGFFGRYSVGAGGVVSADTNQTLFAEIGRDITYCQGKGVKVVMAIGGDQSSPYKWSTGDGKRYANLWYNSFLNGTTDATAPRPFGKAVLDGLQLDIETTGQGWIQEIVDFMVTIKKLSPGSIYSIVPECQSGQVKDQDLNTGPVIQDPSVHLDYIIIQYYNNPTCSYPFGFNYATWKTYFKGPIALGLASDESSAITGGFLNPGQLQAVLDMVSSDSQFYVRQFGALWMENELEAVILLKVLALLKAIGEVPVVVSGIMSIKRVASILHVTPTTLARVLISYVSTS